MQVLNEIFYYVLIKLPYISTFCYICFLKIIYTILNMKKAIFTYTLLTLIIGLGFSSCKENDDYWVSTTFDYDRLPTISQNGNFITSGIIRLDDIRGINQSQSSIIDIETKNAWLLLYGDISRNDDFIIYDITINGVTLNLTNYRYNAAGTEKEITFQNDPAYIDFMYQAMKLLNERGQISVSVSGWSKMSKGNLYITLCHNLDVLIRE